MNRNGGTLEVRKIGGAEGEYRGKMGTCTRLSIDILELLRVAMNAYVIAIIRRDRQELKGSRFW